MKNIAAFLALTLFLIAPHATASVRVWNSGGTQLGSYTDLQLGNGLSVNQVSGKAKVAVVPGDGTQTDGGFLAVVSSTSGSLTQAQCGSTITNSLTQGPAPVYNLPTLAPALYGCKFTFIVGYAAASGLAISPDASSKILVLNSTAGHSISNSVVGDSVTIEAIAPGWAPVGAPEGSWTAN